MSTIAPPSLHQDPLASLKKGLEALPSASRLDHTVTESLYGLAYQYATQGRIEQAFDVFRLLALYAPTEVRYLRGLALSCKLLKRYEDAVGFNQFCAYLEPDQPGHALSAAECLLLMGDEAECRVMLKHVDEYCASHVGFDAVAERARAILSLIGSAGQSEHATA